jgi:hypothetical protein
MRGICRKSTNIDTLWQGVEKRGKGKCLFPSTFGILKKERIEREKERRGTYNLKKM